MLQFTKLRMNGFKSFVERTEVEIGPGLNGIVGPNGCGKSNIVEALRWVMGETSAKRMRGGGMEDVIFNGTARRTARNIAEVSILLDNEKRTAPAAYNSHEEIEVTRRIERDRGSNYKINGRNVRARDVQMLFADTVTGANSPSMVSQGRVTRIINSKPLERRLILEESAGISGLFARRHEAELRLRAADKNLVRIEDVLGEMEKRLNDLKRQARQASRYRNIGAQIRQLEILIACLGWQKLNERRKTAREKFKTAESLVAEKMTAVTKLTKTQTEQSDKLKPLRNKETELAASLQTQKLTLQRLEDESARLAQDRQTAKDQLTQTKTDEDHEKQSLEESATALEKLDKEQKNLKNRQNNQDKSLQEKQALRDKLEKKVITLEEQYNTLMQNEAESKARAQALEQQIQQNDDRLETARRRKTQAQKDLEALIKNDKSDKEYKELENNISLLEKKLKKLNKDILQSQKRQKTCRSEVETAREALKKAENRYSGLQAEIKMLESFLKNDQSEEFSPVLDSVTTESGFEKALSRALGDALLASLEHQAPAYWISRKSLEDMPDLPEKAEPLLPHVKAPQELHLALSQIGLVHSDETGRALIDRLSPGQALVSPEGTYWRWDGLCIKAEAADQNTVHLEQKNKLQALVKKRPDIEKQARETETAFKKISKDLEELENNAARQQEKRAALEQEIAEIREKYTAAREKHMRRESEIKRLNDHMETTGEDIQTLEEVIVWDKERLKNYKEKSEARKAEDIQNIKQKLDEAREAYQNALSAYDVQRQEFSSRKARLHAIADERINLQNRTIRARERLKQLESRKESLEETLKELNARPDDFAKNKETALDRISALEGQRNEAAEALARFERDLAETTKSLRMAENALNDAREVRGGAQATLSALEEQRDSMQSAIQEQFDMPPEKLADHAALESPDIKKDLEALKQQKDKLTRERDSIGPVNLRADEEMQDLEKEVTGLLNERNDLLQAIEELRAGIQKINKEARGRLLNAFEHVNAHFQTLFTRLFGGGKAHLALIDSDDPLESGLEIFAQPPGKTLQSLSLLSGGEQTLASIALIFAMFLTNPSPICVLDEIDAPLDDANVDRVCDLLEEIAERGETRFVIITHHRMTMARMDRLYGVTMAEKGVSQLVSVDLQQSFDFLEEAA